MAGKHEPLCCISTIYQNSSVPLSALLVDQIEARGGGGGYLSTFRGTGTCRLLGVLFKTVTELWVSSSQMS